MSWSIDLTRPARKHLRVLPTTDRKRIADALESMELDPLSGDVVKLKGADAFRRRVGSYRIVFEIDLDAEVVCVVAILRRTSTTYR